MEQRYRQIAAEKKLSSIIYLYCSYQVCYEIINYKMEEHYPEILWRYLGKERDIGTEYHGETTRAAANICGTSQVTSDPAKGPEPVSRQERAHCSDEVRTLEEAELKLWGN